MCLFQAAELSSRPCQLCGQTALTGWRIWAVPLVAIGDTSDRGCLSGKFVAIRLFALAIAIVVAGGAGLDAFNQITPAAPLQLSLPVLASGESVDLEVGNIPSWRAYISWPGVAIAMVGSLSLLALASLPELTVSGWLLRWIALGLIAAGVLLQTNGAPWFFGLLALAILFSVRSRSNSMDQEQSGSRLQPDVSENARRPSVVGRQ